MEIKLAESDSRVGIGGAGRECEYRLFETTGTYSRCAISAKCGWPRFSLRYPRWTANLCIEQLENVELVEGHIQRLFAIADAIPGLLAKKKRIVICIAHLALNATGPRSTIVSIVIFVPPIKDLCTIN